MSTYQNYLSQIAELTQKAEEARRAELRAVIDEIKRKVAEHGLTEQDVFGSAARRAADRPKAGPKYRGPDGKLWNGRGPKPAWAARILEAGGSLSAYQIA